MDAKNRKRQTLEILKASVNREIEAAKNSGNFEAWWYIPQLISERKTYYMLTPLINYFKNLGFVVEFYDESYEKLYFNWFEVPEEIRISIF